MANNYVQMSEAYKLNKVQVYWVKSFLYDCKNVIFAQDDEEEERLTDEELDRRQRVLAVFGDLTGNCEPEDLTTEVNCQMFLNRDNELEIRDEEYVNVNLAIAVLQAMLRDTGSNKVLTGTWAETCSKPRVGEFGGGWFAVSAQEVRTGGTWSAAEKAAKELAKV